ncbi:hypothetical protein J2S43_001419 [Catenuloplanes nepalensis]|uniref:Tetratricopeptide repeat protein n=1 Tax=Catenuloplanes nepalensis TaxID=587533 RepID=A0ABT9MN80_9ACTN|nr:tetratricopeptide repeat protein [Catenuloplanes nepalensis]MDP9792907.1 hypothetical protein [Catenuloplanes nepalensis]
MLPRAKRAEASDSASAPLRPPRRSRSPGARASGRGLDRAGRRLAQQRYPEAERAYRDLIADQRIALGADDPDTLTTCVDLAWAIGMQGRCGEAAQMCATVAETESRVIGPEHIRTLDARYDLARWLLGDGRLDEFHAEAEDLLAVSVRVLGARHPMSLLTRAVIARSRAAEGHDAGVELDEILAELDASLGPLDYRTVLVRQDRAEALATSDRRRQLGESGLERPRHDEDDSPTPPASPE